MKTVFSNADFTDAIRILKLEFNFNDFLVEQEALKDFPLITLGRRSYCVASGIESYTPYHIHIGHYSSLAVNMNFMIDMGHDYKSVTNYPFYCLKINDKFPKAFTDDYYIGNRKRQIFIGSDVWIGQGVTIMSGVHIGNGAIVAANSMVTKDVAPYTIVGGNPAKPIRKRFSDEICDKLNVIKWWNWPEKQILDTAELMRTPEKFVEKFYEPIRRQESKARDWFRKQRGEGGKLFLALVDESLSYPDYPHILEEYKRVRKTGDFLLFLGYGEPSELSKKQDETWGILYNADAVAMSLLQEADWFIVDKNPNCLLYVDYAQIFDTGILFGMDQFVFERAGR